MHTERENHSEWVFSSTDFSLKLCCQPKAQVICTASTNYLTMDDSCIFRFAVLCATTVEKQNIREQRLKKKKKKSLTCICSYPLPSLCLDASPDGDTFDWQQTVEATIRRRRTSGKTWCPQLQKAAPIKDLDSEHRLTFLPFDTLTWKLCPPVSAFFVISLWLGEN